MASVKLERFYNFLGYIPFALVLVCAVMIYQGVQGLMSISNYCAYTDKGVHTFFGYQVKPHQSQKQFRRPHSADYRKVTYTRYYAVYKANIKEYVHRIDFAVQSDAQQQLENYPQLSLRVIKDIDNNTYTTVAENISVNQYYFSLIKDNIILIGVGLSYILLFAIYCLRSMLSKKKHDKTTDSSSQV